MYHLDQTVMDNDFASSSPPQNNPQESLQAFADLNVLIDRRGAVLGYKAGYFLPPEFPGFAVGERLQDLFAAGEVERFEQALEEVQQTGAAQALEYRLILNDREHWFEARLVPEQDAGRPSCA
jgi:PAS fold